MKNKILFNKGFTLIELLVVIAILGVLVVGLMVAINPADKLNQAGDARVQNDFGALARASESYATTNNNFYPAAIADLVTSAELKLAPVPPTGYPAYVFTAAPPACTAGVTCTSIVVTSALRSNRYAATPFWRYESSTGRTCAVATAATACP